MLRRGGPLTVAESVRIDSVWSDMHGTSTYNSATCLVSIVFLIVVVNGVQQCLLCLKVFH